MSHLRTFRPTKNLVVVFLLLLHAISCSKKDTNRLLVDEEYELLSYDSSVGRLYTYPMHSDSGVNLASSIRVSLTDLQRSQQSTFFRVDFILTENGNPVQGKLIVNDTVAEFNPLAELKPNTDYTASIATEILEKFTNRADKRHKTFYLSESWSFRTRDSSKYVMSRRSQWISDFNRDGSKLMQMGDYLYMYGGWTAEPLLSYSNVYRSSGDLSVWEKLPDAPWPGRHTFGIGKKDSAVFVFGGDHLQSTFDVWKSTDGVNFNLVNGDLSGSVGNRLLYGACVHNNKLFVLGGQLTPELNTGIDDVWSSQDGVAWQRVSSGHDFLAKNISGVVASFMGKIWVTGGGYYKHPDISVRWSNDIYSSVDGNTWDKEPTPPWEGRAYADLCVWDDRLWMIGGDRFGNLADIWYMKKGGSWVQYEAPGNYLARHATAVAVYNDKLVLACGNFHNDCWVIEKE